MSREIYVRVSPANDDSDSLARLWAVTAGEERRKRGRAARFRGDSHGLPEPSLRFDYLIVGHKQGFLHVLLGYGKHQLADLSRRQRVGGYATGGRVNRVSGFEG